MALAPLAARFWRRVTFCDHGDTCPDCCWLWHGQIVRGHGQFSVTHTLGHGNINNVQPATRACWWLTHGVWPPTRSVVQTCDTPLCVQPAHLCLGTPEARHAQVLRRHARTLLEALQAVYPAGLGRMTISHETFGRVLCAADLDRITQLLLAQHRITVQVVPRADGIGRKTILTAVPGDPPAQGCLSWTARDDAHGVCGPSGVRRPGGGSGSTRPL